GLHRVLRQEHHAPMDDHAFGPRLRLHIGAGLRSRSHVVCMRRLDFHVSGEGGDLFDEGSFAVEATAHPAPDAELRRRGGIEACHLDHRCTVGALRLDLEGSQNRAEVRRLYRLEDRMRAVGGDLVRWTAQQDTVIAALPAQDTVANRLAAKATARRVPGDLGHQEHLLVQRFRWDLEVEPLPDLVGPEEPLAVWGTRGDDLIVRAEPGVTRGCGPLTFGSRVTLRRERWRGSFRAGDA